MLINLPIKDTIGNISFRVNKFAYLIAVNLLTLADRSYFTNILQFNSEFRLRKYTKLFCPLNYKL